MPITAINSTSALVAIDIQKGIVALPTVHAAQGVVDNVVRLVRAFREKERPVVLVRVGWSQGGHDAIKARTQTPAPNPSQFPPGFSDYVDALEADPERDVLIVKRQWGAFYGTDLDLATSIGVESTARDAFERSYNLTFASDAMTDRDPGAHDRSLEVIFPRIGEIGTTSEIIAKLT
jgi:nicotinamidase-related amidase